MEFGRRSKMQNKEASIWGVALNQYLGLEGQDNLPAEADNSRMDFVFDLNSEMGFLQSDVKAVNVSGNTSLVGVGAVDYGIAGVGGTAYGANDVIISTGPSAQEGIKNFRVLEACCNLSLNAAGVAALAGVKVRFKWTVYGPNLTSPGCTLAIHEITSPGLQEFSVLTQLLGYTPIILYPNALECTINIPAGGVNFPAATTLRRECRVVLRPLKLLLPK